MGPLTFLAIRALAHDLPEDFILRIEARIDEATRRALERGIQASRSVDRFQTWSVYSAFAGGILLLLALGTAASFPAIVILLLGLLAASLTIAVALASAAVLMAVLRRDDLRRLDGYVRAYRRSSLARDLA
jgi:hypothetical protein